MSSTTQRWPDAIRVWLEPLRRLRRSFGPMWHPLRVSLLPLFCDGFFQAAGPLALRQAIDNVNRGSFGSGSLAVAVCVFAFGASRCTRGLLLYRFDMAAAQLRRSLAEKVYRHVHELPYRAHAQRTTGEFERKVSEGVNGVRSMEASIVFGALPLVFQSLMITLVLLTMGQLPLLGALAASMAMYAWLFYRGVRSQRTPFIDAAKAESSYSGTAVDSLLNYETVKLFTGEDSATERIAGRLIECETRWQRLFRVRRAADLASAALFVVIMSLLLLLVLQRIAAGALSVGSFVLVSAYTIQLLPPIEALGAAIREFMQATGHALRLADIMDELPEDPGGCIALLPGQPIDVVLHDLHFSYDHESAGLRGIDLVIPAGSLVAFVGASGSGKTTLIRLLLGLLKPQRGHIRVGGHDTAAIARDSLRRAIGVVAQDTILFNDTLRYNVAFGTPEADDEAIRSAAALAGLDRMIDQSPEGWSTMVGERGLRLSGGERQRVAIARAILRRPGLFVFDEATASLDTTTERQIQENLERVSRGVTTLVVAHRLPTVRHADTIVVFDEGRIVERGSHEELLNLGGTYAALWNAQHRRFPE